MKPIITIDFDGTIHSYEHGWQGGEIYGQPVKDFFRWALSAAPTFRLVIYSSRSKTAQQATTMADWVKKEFRKWWKIQGHEGEPPAIFEFSNVKPPAMLTIDDAALQFNGDWNDPQLCPERLKAFEPWHKNGRPVTLIKATSFQADLSEALHTALKEQIPLWQDWPGTDAIAQAVTQMLFKKGTIR